MTSCCKQYLADGSAVNTATQNDVNDRLRLADLKHLTQEKRIKYHRPCCSFFDLNCKLKSLQLNAPDDL